MDSSAILTILSDDPDRPAEVGLVGAVVETGTVLNGLRPERRLRRRRRHGLPRTEELYHDGIDQIDGLNDYDQDLDGYETDSTG